MSSSLRRATGITAVLALLAALLSAFALSTSAQAVPSGYVGTTSGPAWPDATLALMTVNESYSDSLTSPIDSDARYGAVTTSGDVPPGITIEGDVTNLALIHVTGTPTTAGTYEFSVIVPGESNATLDFVITIDSVVPATTTELASPQFSPYSAMNLTATVTGAAAGGTVTFSINGDDIGTGTLDGDGVATYTGDVDPMYLGDTWPIIATYEGVDGLYAASSSGSVDVYIYGYTTVSGRVKENGSAVEATVSLITTGGTSVDSVTSTGGSFTLSPGTPTTLVQAQAQYYIKAVYDGRTAYYAAAGGRYLPTIDNIDDADATGPGQWIDISRNIFFTLAPVWNDSTLATPHLGVAYHDGVTASGTAVIHYVVSSGILPTGLELDGDTGEITGTPTDPLRSTFTITASNDYGSVAKTFEITPGDPGVPPTFVDTTIATPTVGTAFHEDVHAMGDPTIVYSSGALPAGLTLDSASGVISGTPTAAGEFSVLITATNEFGHDDYTWAGTIVAVPAIDLVLNFQAGTPLGDADSQISASGLKVGSTYTLDLHSDPIRLYTGIVDGSGGFTWLVSLPADTPAGTHELILTGVAPDGTVMTAHAWFTLLANGRIGAVSYNGPIALAFTGAQAGIPIGLAGGLLSLGLVGVLLGRARRSERR